MRLLKSAAHKRGSWERLDKRPDLECPVVVGLWADGDGRERDVPDGVGRMVDEGDDRAIVPVIEHGHLQRDAHFLYQNLTSNPWRQGH